MNKEQDANEKPYLLYRYGLASSGHSYYFIEIIGNTYISEIKVKPCKHLNEEAG
jgi:hypothetical protein